MFTQMKDHLAKQLAEIKANGLYKVERTIITPQSSAIRIAERSGKVLNFCANNYLGLSDNPRLISAAKKAMDSHGFGMSSVRFICGAQDLHRELEKAIARYFHTEDTILYAACFDANGGVFEPLFTEEDAIISDALNHASIIDGVRLCKAKRYRYANADMEELERCLQEAQAQRFRIIVTDGVFSMDGNVAPMDKICDLAEKYNALVMVDECHSYRHSHRDIGKSVRRRYRRIHHRTQRDYRHAASAVETLPFLQLAPSRRSGSRNRSIQNARRKRRTPYPLNGERHLFPRQDARSRLRHQAYPIGHLCSHAV